MFRWVPYAMVRVAAFFIAGILLAIYKPDLIGLFPASLIAGFFLVAYVFIFLLTPLKKHRFAIGIIGLVGIFFLGYIHLLVFVKWGDKNHISTFKKEIKYYVAIINDYPEEKDNSWRYEVELEKVYDGKSWHIINGTLLLYINKEDDQQTFFYGDKILVKGNPQLLSPPQNPHEFDFKRFLSFKNIFHQQFARHENVQLIASSTLKDIRYYSFMARAWASRQLEIMLPNKQEQAIAKALTLGVKDGIDNDLQKAYAASGAMHVLAVSGLHVGILYGIVLLCFRPFMGLSWSRWVVAAVSIIILWSFAFITGLSPSVLRAVTMFTFFALAKPFGRSTSIYNTLAGSAFILLLADPFLVMSVGFQLSYLAVLGIVAIHRPLYQILESRSVVLDWIWNISCVSIAAQLATFALGLLYFHQFPVYFLFSNLFIIPGAIMVLVLSIIAIAFSIISPMANLLGTLLQGLIKALNYGVFMIEGLPNSLITGIYVDTLQCWLIMLSIGFFLIFLYFRKLSALAISFAFVLCFAGTRWHHYVNEVNQNLFVVYNISDHQAFEWVSNGRSMFFVDSALIADSDRVRFHILPNRLYHGISSIETRIINFKKHAEVVAIGGKTIGILTKEVKSWPYHLQLDYLIVANNSISSFNEIRMIIPFDHLILDSSNSRYLASQILEEGGDQAYSVLHSGAFIEKF